MKGIYNKRANEGLRGFIQTYTFGERSWQDAINLSGEDRENRDKLARLYYLLYHEGVPLGNAVLFGLAGHERFYDTCSFLYHQVVASFSRLKEDDVQKDVRPCGLPEIVVHLIGKKPKNLQDVAIEFELPVPRLERGKFLELDVPILI